MDTFMKMVSVLLLAACIWQIIKIGKEEEDK